MISVFDMFKIGIGPSSSHTVGPMKAGNIFIKDLTKQGLFETIDELRSELFGSLGQTGKGHGTGKAVILGLMGEAPDTVDTDKIDAILENVSNNEKLLLSDGREVKFSRANGVTYHRRKSLPAHANAMTLYAYTDGKCIYERTYYSVGGGFILDEDEIKAQDASPATPIKSAPYDFESAQQLLELCTENGFSISSLMMANELSINDSDAIQKQLWEIWQTMKSCVERGYQKEGILPGGLKLRRRAPSLYRRLKAEGKSVVDPFTAMDWVDLFALSVNEQNAAGDRVVTAPTNGAAGIIPAVLSYYDMFVQEVDMDVCCRYLLTAAAIGILYKKNASISGAEVGCQGEVGVACSMAAAALTEIMGGTIEHVENAAEIGMEHNLGLTCDPVGGLVQVPCIERNAMGAVKAINASRMAMRGDGNHKVSLDKVIKTMMDTGKDMRSKYKETAKGGLAVNIVEC
ncbi:L-serine ammonia-lyase [Shewanella sp. Choline-02u-19]|uniref:L-serine ammonia-lyase n=1 Tax=unclassified Shewanella TaxID=196818 RepID=UPI000C338C1A|nr:MULTISPECIES: L-serine ammonia-lyase [unclassified Shewanella]PKG56354.1 L-serine ammonia-lyase [Shewanella sp. GutDb-MelDb]PKG73365.1 L-serine ammonia-lyase [Shewanella sp. GutCb]PKH59167.1 L-serine ammonia-lyase [Shewanella sp. Bg11-22]PKI27042.1 L-serine ammonia-lyase [Shewanella sp. Choline-02u-19]